WKKEIWLKGLLTESGYELRLVAGIANSVLVNGGSQSEVPTQEPSYNQNYNDNYYSHDLPSFPCCDNCGEFHETFQCQPMDQNVDFSGSDQIQTQQYPEIHPHSQEIRDEDFHAKGDLMKSIQTFLEEFNCIPFEEKPQILLQAWDHPNFFDNNEDHSVQNKEYSKNSSKEITSSSSNQEKERPPQDSDIRQLIKKECCIEVCEEQKQNMENTILELVEICRQKELLCMHDNVDELIESALNSKLLSINSQLLKKEKQEVKNVVEQPTKQPEYSPSMGYEHLSTTPETKLYEVTESSTKNLLPIPRECEVTSENENDSDMPAKDDFSPAFTTFSNALFKDNDDLTSSDDESLSEEDVPIEESKVYLNPLFNNDEIYSDELESHVESNFIKSLSNHDALIDSSQKIDYLEEFSGELTHINPKITESDFNFEKEIRLIENLLYDNSSPRPPEELNAKIANTIVESIPSSLILVQDNDSQREKIDIVTNTDELLPPSVKNDDDSEGEIDAVDDVRVDNSISNSKNKLSDNEESDFDNPSFLRPPPEPPDAEPDSGEVISAVMNKTDELNEDECFDPGGVIDVSINDKDDSQRKVGKDLLKGHSTLSLEDSLSGDYDVKKNGSLKANLQHMEAFSTTEAGYMTFIKAWKNEIWLKGLLTESGYELRLVAGIATSVLVNGGSQSEVPTQVKVVAYRY
nr:hypothetical protein [Tanacetum cinerariifolium]